MRTTSSYALGIKKMLLIKLLDIKKLDYGRAYPPKALVLHPRVYQELAETCSFDELRYSETRKLLEWRGIHLVIDDSVREAYFVTAQGLRETL